uniref:LIM zinc-binding domain-containing protein n=1 Tax=Kryptolebias marmoratus TaxID=37003 RepID=A0A3Q2ZYZ0_KRYMA
MLKTEERLVVAVFCLYVLSRPSVCPNDVCFFCQQKVYVMERLSAEGLFFHRSCFCCDSCSVALRPPSYTFHRDGGSGHCFCDGSAGGGAEGGGGGGEAGGGL